jgi:DnaD/phage-associated family protein
VEKKAEPAKKKMKRSEELPSYTSDEISDYLEKHQETAMLIHECHNILGKMLNVKEINVLIGFLDYLRLDCEYIMMLLTYCMSIGKDSLHYAETLAFALYDAGITTGAQLAEELKRRENAAAAEGKIRQMFGVGARALTTKERKFISSWINDFRYPVEIIEKAYETTADATGKGSFAYANAILERWNSEGLRTLEEIEAANKQKSETPSEGSFDTDSFFEAAVRRSLGEDFKIE